MLLKSGPSTGRSARHGSRVGDAPPSSSRGCATEGGRSDNPCTDVPVGTEDCARDGPGARTALARFVSHWTWIWLMPAYHVMRGSRQIRDARWPAFVIRLYVL